MPPTKSQEIQALNTTIDEAGFPSEKANSITENLWKTTQQVVDSIVNIEGEVKLEWEAFRIERTQEWRLITDINWVKLYENPTGDVWEIVEGEFAWEQLFTWDAAVRETRKAGKSIPSVEEMKAMFDIFIKAVRAQKLKRTGLIYRSPEHPLALCNQRKSGRFWLYSLEGDSHTCNMYFDDWIGRISSIDKISGVSVYCKAST